MLSRSIGICSVPNPPSRSLPIITCDDPVSWQMWSMCSTIFSIRSWKSSRTRAVVGPAVHHHDGVEGHADDRPRRASSRIWSSSNWRFQLARARQLEWLAQTGPSQRAEGVAKRVVAEVRGVEDQAEASHPRRSSCPRAVSGPRASVPRP